MDSPTFGESNLISSSILGTHVAARAIASVLKLLSSTHDGNAVDFTPKRFSLAL